MNYDVIIIALRIPENYDPIVRKDLDIVDVNPHKESTPAAFSSARFFFIIVRYFSYAVERC